MRKLGSTQRQILEALEEYGGWHEYCGWVHGGTYGTRKAMEALAKRGSARVDRTRSHPVTGAAFRQGLLVDYYRISEQGRQEIRELEQRE